MRQGIQVNVAVLQVCCQFMRDPRAQFWPYEIAKRLGVSSQYASDLLARLERAGWMESEWERIEHIGWRPRRKLYRLTDMGRKRTTESLARLRIKVSG